MSLTIKDETVVAAIHRLAERTGRTPEDAVRHAVEAESTLVSDAPDLAAADRPKGTVSPEERARRRAALKEIQDEVASWPKTGLKADKAFFDAINDDL